MSRIWSKITAMMRNRTFIGADKTGNQYYVRTEQIDGIMKEKRWVEFKGEVDSTSIPGADAMTAERDKYQDVMPYALQRDPFEWICWLNGQRKVAPTPEEMAMLEARRQRVKENVARLKKEEEERKAREGSSRKITSMGKGDGPDLKSFIQQLPVASEDKSGEASEATGRKIQDEKKVPEQAKQEPESTEPTGSGASFRPGTWQPPS